MFLNSPGGHEHVRDENCQHQHAGSDGDNDEEAFDAFRRQKTVPMQAGFKSTLELDEDAPLPARMPLQVLPNHGVNVPPLFAFDHTEMNMPDPIADRLRALEAELNTLVRCTYNMVGSSMIGLSGVDWRMFMPLSQLRVCHHLPQLSLPFPFAASRQGSPAGPGAASAHWAPCP